MEIIKKEHDEEVTMSIVGRLDTNSAPTLTKELEESLVDGVEVFVLDMSECDYVASSGLRAILSAQKKMNSLHGKMIVRNVIGDVMEVFEMTGFADILTFE
ncbi:MAG: STAS domain-containing protein [Lachnospiraceae bacterium]|nr:STAS domain-containing protein [Lachnospiraceae bacterium]